MYQLWNVEMTLAKTFLGAWALFIKFNDRQTKDVIPN